MVEQSKTNSRGLTVGELTLLELHVQSGINNPGTNSSSFVGVHKISFDKHFL